jgi:hypothetical protein
VSNQRKIPMKHPFAKLLWIITRYLGLTLVCLIVMGAIYVALLKRPDGQAQNAAGETRQMLRQQGFKTDLSEFDFSTSPEMREREAMLKDTAPDRRSEPFVNHPNLMELVGNEAVNVVWQQDSLKNENPSWPNNSDQMTWEEFRQAINVNQSQIDAACASVMSGRVGFNLNSLGGNAILLPHLAMLKNLTQTLGSRTILNLHDGNLDAAWTNLMTATRLVTAWEPEPAEVSELVRFGNTTLAFNAIWQALQTNGWSDDQLARLQQEWVDAEFFKNLPETAAFKRASSVLTCEQERRRTFSEGMPLSEFFKEGLRHPQFVWSDFTAYINHLKYARRGSYEDEKELLLFYRDREVEMRNAVQSATWAQMRQLPGVTNTIFFQSTNHSRLLAITHLRELGTAFQKQGAGFLGRAAEAEARRRILVSAIALERYRIKHENYPQTLADLSPEFLKAVPVDFMDGQPLRYRLTDDGHFSLYSVGLDCVDNGGVILTHQKQIRANRVASLFGVAPDVDIVWPLPASNAAVVALRQEQLTARRNKADEMDDLQARSQWEHAAHHQADVEKLLSESAAQNPPDVNYHGRPLSEALWNSNASATNQLTLGQMLTIKQIITGDEPENITFELPVAYDAVTNLGSLCLFIDTNNDDCYEGCNVQQMECRRAGNGNCLLAWSTIYESPGRHALQAGLLLNEIQTNNPDISGPLLPYIITNLCQFSTSSAHFDLETGATWRAKLPEQNANYIIELKTTNGILLHTLTGSTTNGVIKVHWDLIDDHGQQFTADFFNSIFNITLSDSGRSQTLNGP